MRPLPRKPVRSVFAFFAIKNSGPDRDRRHSGPATARSAVPQRLGFGQRGASAGFPLLKPVLYMLLCLLLPMSLRAQTYIETTSKGPTSNAACDANGLTDSFLLSTTAGTATTKSITLNSNGFYAIGFTTPANAPGLASWQPSTYSLAVENTTTNANVQIFDVCFSQVNSTASVLSSLCQAGSINTALSTAGVRTYSCRMTTTLATNTTDRLIGILLLKNTVGSRQSVTLKFNTSTDALTVTPLPVPAISSVSPTSGPAGTAVTISGSTFGATRGTGSVTFNGTAATITSWSDTSIVATVPALTASGNIVVTSGGGIASNGVSFTVPAPSISNISPDSERVGASVTVGGTNFGSLAGRISFNGTNATSSSWSNTQIVVPVPSGATTGLVIVTQGVASNSASFAVIPPPTISGVSPASGAVNSQITISGSGFGIPRGSGSVTFNGTVATPFSWSDSSIIVPVPAGATAGPLVVTAGGINSNSFAFTVTPGPSITGISPSTGAAGAAISISGQNFGASQGLVRINGLPASVTSWSPTSIGATVPANVSTGPVTVSVGQQVSNGVTFTAITSGTLSGAVSSSADGSAISGATIQALQNGAVKASTTTAANGTYSLTGLAAGKYDLKASASSFGSALQNSVAVTAGQTSTANFSLSAPTTISGTVTQADGTTPLSGVSVQVYVGSAAGSSATTDSAGSYSIAGLNTGPYTVQATAAGYVAQSRSVTLSGSAATSNFSLQSSGANPITYVYDELGRLTGVVDSAGDSATYKYDAVGNILSITRQSSSQLAVISFTPQSGPVGTTVTINGTAFSPTASQNTIQFNGTTASIVSASTTQLVVTVPAGATTGPISVSTGAGAVSSSSNFTVAANSGVPSITSFTPNMGTPGTAVTITGTNFDVLANDKVSFNTTRTAATSATSTQIGTSVPANATSGKIAVTTPGGQGTSLQDFYVPFGTHVVADIGYTGRVSSGGNQTVALAANQIGLLLFDGVAGQGVSLQLSGSTFAGCTLYIFAPGGGQLTSSNCTSGTAFVGSVTETVTGTYTIGIEPGANAGTINIALTPDVSGVITAGTPVTATTTAPGQSARYMFSGTAGQRVSLNLSGSTYAGCNGVVVSILKPDGSMLGSTGLCNTATGFLDSLLLPTGGTYTALVDPQGTATGSITVLLNSFTDVSGAITAGVALTATTTAPGQNALYTFSGTAGQQFSINMSGSTYTGCNAVVVSLVKPDGTNLASSGICNGSSGFMDSQTLPTTGTYTVKIDPQGTTTGSITVLLNSFADVTGTITAETALTATTTTPGQNALYTFSGTAGQQFSINLSGSTYVGCNAVVVSIVKPDNTSLASAGICNGTTGFLDSQTLPTTGTYTVKVDPQGTTTGSITVLLNNFSDINGTITPGTPLTATTTTPGQNARYTFSGTAGQQFSINLSGSTYVGCNAVVLSIVKPDGSTLGSTGLCNTATGFLDSQTLPTTGTYTVLVNPQGTTAGSITILLSSFADVTGTITAGTALTATTTTPGQNALYTFSGTSGQHVSINLSGSTYVGCNAVVVSIVKPDGTNLASSGICNSSTGFMDSQTLPTTGTYTVKVDPQGVTTGSVTVLLNSFADVTGTITVGTAITATTTVPGQNALYTFTGTSAQQVSVSLTGSTYTGCNAVVVSILKSDGTSVGSTGLCNTSTGLLNTVTLPADGTYTLKIDPQGTTTGSITAQINNATDVLGTITPGTPVTITTTISGQNARYTFSGTAGQQASLNLSSSTYTGCNGVVVSILKPDGSTLGSSGLCNTATGFLDSLTLPTTGTYTVFVDPQGTVTGSITVLLNSFADVTGTISAGTALTATTTTPGQNAFYTFSGTAGQQVSINITSSTYTGCNALTVSILKPDNTTLASTSLCNTAAGFLDSQTLPTTGTYTVKVDPQGATTGSVTLLLNSFADVTGTISAGTALTATTTTPGQNALYTFSGTAGQQVSINITSSTYTGCNALTVSILKPDNTTLASTSLCNTATGFLDSQTLPTTGTYKVKVDPQGTTTGSVTVLLNFFADVTGTISAGTALTASTTTPGQNALYTFSGTSGQQFSINLSGSTYVGCNAVVVSILKPDNTSLASTGLCNTTTGFLDSQTLSTTGTYTVKVDPQGTTTGSITVLLNNFGDINGTITPGTPLTATTTTPGQNARYTFSGTAGQQFSINLSGSTYVGCNAVVVSIVKPDNTTLGSTGLCNTATGFLDSQTLPTTGTYTVRVDPAGTTTGSITILLNSFADVTGTITAGTALTATTTTPGQNALYTFSGTTGQQVSINMSGSTYVGCNAVVVSILKPDNTSLGSAGICNGSTGFLDSLTLPTTGTYTVKVDPQGTTTGSVTVLLNFFTDVTGTIASGTPVSVTTTSPGQNALYTFSGVTGQSASVSTTGSTYTGCNAVVISILKPGGSSLGSSGICNNTSGSLGPLSLPTSGTYTVKVDPQSVGAGSATVTLTVTGP
jgi:YD repeat-containing protein